MFSQLIKLIRILSSETAPIAISMGFALAMIAGLTPLFNLHNILVILVLLMFRINLAAFLLGWLFFSGLAYLLDPVFHDLGKNILLNADLNPLFTDMYNQPWWRISNFNNSIVMGSLAVSLIAFIPFILISNFLIRHYRSDVMTYLEKSRLFKTLKSNKWVSRAVSVMEER
jgi:uncharacterized protein (TIGR03546 family)